MDLIDIQEEEGFIGLSEDEVTYSLGENVL